MTTATTLDMSLIAVDATFKGRVQAALFQYCTQTVLSESCADNGSLTPQRHQIRKAYAANVLNNISNFITSFCWVAAANQTLANDVVTANGANFTTSTTGATVAAAVTTATPTSNGATDTDINNAVAAAFNLMANA